MRLHDDDIVLRKPCGKLRWDRLGSTRHEPEHRDAGTEDVVEAHPRAIQTLHERLRKCTTDRRLLVGGLRAEHETIGIARHRLVLHLQNVLTGSRNLLGTDEQLVAYGFGKTVSGLIQRTHLSGELHHYPSRITPLRVVRGKNGSARRAGHDHAELPGE